MKKVTNDEADALLENIYTLIPLDKKYLILIVDGEDVSNDTYHQADNLKYIEMLKVLHVLKGRTIELKMLAPMKTDELDK